MKKRRNGNFVRAATVCGSDAVLVHVGVIGKAHRGCPRNQGAHKTCRWKVEKVQR